MLDFNWLIPFGILSSVVNLSYSGYCFKATNWIFLGGFSYYLIMASIIHCFGVFWLVWILGLEFVILVLFFWVFRFGSVSFLLVYLFVSSSLFVSSFWLRVFICFCVWLIGCSSMLCLWLFWFNLTWFICFGSFWFFNLSWYGFVMFNLVQFDLVLFDSIRLVVLGETSAHILVVWRVKCLQFGHLVSRMLTFGCLVVERLQFGFFSSFWFFNWFVLWV